MLSYMGGNEATLLVIREESTTDRDNIGEERNPNKLADEAYHDYVSINISSSHIPIDTSWNSKVHLLTKEELNNIFNKSSLELEVLL